MQDNHAHQHPYRKRLAHMESERSKFETVWREIEENIAPKTLRLDESEYNDGDKGHQKILDETVLRARRVYVAGFVSGMTSPSRPWFRLTTEDSGLTDSHGVRVWLDEVQRRMELLFSRSNFYQAIARCYDDLGTYGTCAMTQLENNEHGIWFYPHVMGTYYVAQNDDGLVDTLYRETTKTVRQLVETFGIGNVSSQTRSMFEQRNLDQHIKVYNAIEPNDASGPQGGLFNNFAYRSVWWEAASDANAYLGERGFEEFPAVVARWYATSLDDYGVDCPGVTALQPCKELYHDTKRMAQAIDKTVNPPVQAPSQLRNKTTGRVNLMPGGVTYYDSATPNAGIQPLFQMNFPVGDLAAKMDLVRDRINQSYFVDLFLMMANEPDVRTATEVMIRQEEKMLTLGPVVSRVQTELLDPIINRTFAIMARNGGLPPVPGELEGQELKVKYLSMLAAAQQSVGASSVERLIGTAASMEANGFSGTIDKINSDAVIEDYAEILGVSERLLRDDDEVEAIRQNRAQQQMAAEAAETMKNMATAAKTASEVNTEEGSVYDRLTGG